jgi:hypothetical protein
MRVLPPTGDLSELRVIAGSGYGPRRRRASTVLHVERDPARIAHVVALLDVAAPWRPSSWMEQPERSLVLLVRRTVLTEIGLLGRGWLRTQDSDDPRLSDRGPLDLWRTGSTRPAERRP